VRFISSLKSLLASEEEQHHTQDSNPHFITQPARIKHMLQLLMESHVQVSVVFDEQSDHTSMLLDISTNEITLDQLNSRAAHHKMQPGQIIQINAKHHSVPLNFSSTITAISKNGDYLCSMPEKIYHPQKRAFFEFLWRTLKNTNSAVRFNFLKIWFQGISMMSVLVELAWRSTQILTLKRGYSFSCQYKA
jgi:hypothetical protein